MSDIRGRRPFVAFAFLALATCARTAAPVEPFPLPAGVHFAQNPNLPPGGEIAILSGSPGSPGLYATRVRFVPGLKVMPHSHPEDRIYTVLTGTWTIGLGSTFDSTQLQDFHAGAVYRLPANTVHFHMARADGALFQVTGVGPTSTTYVRPEDDPRRQ
ncbi:MAG: cupin domain-containing protein [Gemmatimonadota bacterium]